jgi:hypothetical protein
MSARLVIVRSERLLNLAADARIRSEAEVLRPQSQPSLAICIRSI